MGAQGGRVARPLRRSARQPRWPRLRARARERRRTGTAQGMAQEPPAGAGREPQPSGGRGRRQPQLRRRLGLQPLLRRRPRRCALFNRTRRRNIHRPERRERARDEKRSRAAAQQGNQLLHRLPRLQPRHPLQLGPRHQPVDRRDPDVNQRRLGSPARRHPQRGLRGVHTRDRRRRPSSDGETHERSHLHPERRLGSPRAGALALHRHAIGQPLRDPRGRRRLLLLAVVHGGDRQIADPPGDGLHDRGRRRSQRRPRPRRGGLHPQLRHAIPEARARDPSRRVGLPDGGRVVERRGALGARAPGEPLTMSDDGTLQQLAGAVTETLQPLQTRLAAGDARGLIAEMGLSLPPALDGLPAFTTATADAITKVEALGAPAATLATAVQHEDVGAIIEATTTLISAITEAIAALDAVATALSSVAGSVGVANPSDITTFAASFGEKLLEHVVIDYLAGYRPVLLRGLALLGIVDLSLVPPDGGDPTKVAHQRHDLTLGNLGQIFSDPGAYLVSQFGWNSPALNSTALLGRLRDLLVELGAKASIDPSTGALDLALLRIAPTSAISPPGLSAILAESLSDGLTLPLPSVLPEGWTAQLVVGGTLAAGVELRILPPGQLEGHAKANVDGQLQFAATRAPPAGQRVTILGLPGIATLDAASIGLTSGASFHWDSGSGAARGAFVVGFAVNGGKLHVGSSNADGFVASLLGGLDLEADFDLQAGWAGDRGIYLGGNAGIGTTIGVHVSIGPFTLDSIHLELTVGGAGLDLETSVTGSGTLGPISASVERIGAITKLGFAPGNLGPAQLDLAFKPPTGLGIVGDAAAITAGGYISYGPDKGEYAGVVELSLLSISIKAIAVLDTKLPDGSSGFSFLIILTFDLPPIQLGFGFTLNAVGGLAGINRTMVLDALRDALRAHHLDSILFPPDPVRDAPQIISDIRTIFPPAQGRYGREQDRVQVV